MVVKSGPAGTIEEAVNDSALYLAMIDAVTQYGQSGAMLIGGVVVNLYAATPRKVQDVDFLTPELSTKKPVPSGYELDYDGRIRLTSETTGAQVEFKTAKYLKLPQSLAVKAFITSRYMQDPATGINFRYAGLPCMIALKLWASDQVERREFDFQDIRNMMSQYPAFSWTNLGAKGFPLMDRHKERFRKLYQEVHHTG